MPDVNRHSDSAIQGLMQPVREVAQERKQFQPLGPERLLAGVREQLGRKPAGAADYCRQLTFNKLVVLCGQFSAQALDCAAQVCDDRLQRPGSVGHESLLARGHVRRCSHPMPADPPLPNVSEGTPCKAHTQQRKFILALGCAAASEPSQRLSLRLHGVSSGAALPLVGK